jgi:MFS family permease
MRRHINPVVRTFVVADFFLNSAAGSFAPIFAIFIANQITGGSAEVAGFAASAYWIVKSAVQLPIARFLDRRGEQADFWAVFGGYFVSGFVPFAYTFVRTPLELYTVQAIFGFAMAWAVPAWYSLFTRHVDRWRIGFEWSLESVFSVGLATAVSTAVGGYVASRYGFQALFMAAGCVSIASSLLLLGVKPYLEPLRRRPAIVPPERHNHHHH